MSPADLQIEIAQRKAALERKHPGFIAHVETVFLAVSLKRIWRYKLVPA